MSLSKLQVKMADGKLVAVLNGLDITPELLGLNFSWENGKAPIAHLAVAVQAGDLDLFAQVTKQVAATVPPDAPEPPALEAQD